MKRLLAYVLTLCLACTLVPTAVFAEDTVTDNSHLITYEQPKNAFDYYIDGDPQQIPDDEFFGVWDAGLNDWVKQPYFRYDEFPDMINVKEAAMAGDYYGAKEELLAYYRTVRDSRYLPVTSNPGSFARLRAQLLEKNVYAATAGGPQGLITFGNEWSEQSANVAEAVIDRQLVGYGKTVAFVLMSVDKHLTQAEITARESGKPARLELVVNDAPVVLEASRDTEVRAGAYNTINFGSNPTMIVQESGHFNNYNENTRRAYIAFDVSFLKPTDKLTSARLVVNGRNASGTGDKELLVYHDTEGEFDEYTHTFDDLTEKLWSCNDQNTWDFKSRLDDRGSIANMLRGSDLTVAANMYSYSGQERYAFTFIRQVMGLYYHQGYNELNMNDLDFSVHLLTVTPCVFMVLDSKYMTGEILTAMIKTYWLFAHHEIFKFFGTKDNNWGSFATYGVYSFLSRFREVAVYDEWYNYCLEENDRLLPGFVLEDGMCFELPLNYVVTMLGTLDGPFTVETQTGIKPPFSETALGYIHDIVTTLIYCSSPGWHGYGIADATGDYATNYANEVKQWYQLLFQDDPIIEFVATDGQSGEMPDKATTSYRKSLRTYMRSSWDDDALAMSFINTNHDTASHGQYDHLSVTMFAYGRYLLGDPGLGGLGDTKIFMSSAPQHNLVTINNSDHKSMYGTKELSFETNNMYDFVEYSGVYTPDQVTQSRCVLFLRDQKFWIISDYANPNNQNIEYSYQQNWHMHPTCNISIDDDTLVIQSNTEDINVDLIPVGTGDLTGKLVDTSFFLNGNVEVANQKAVLEKTATGDIVYNTIVLPRDVNEEFEVTADVIDTGLDPTKVNSFFARIKNKQTGKESYYYYYHINDVKELLETNPVVNIAQFETDAATMLIETDLDGNILSTFLMDATFLKEKLQEEKVLFKSLVPVEAISYKREGELFNVSSTYLTDEIFDSITIYAPGQYNVRYDGTFIDGKKSGDYLYFGDTPIIDGGEEGNTGSSGSGSSGTVTPDKDHGSTGTGSSGTGSTGTGSSGTGSTGTGSSGTGNNVTDTPVVVPPIQTEDIPQAIAKELDGHWGKEQIVSLYNDKIITGDNEGLRLSDSISRAEFTTLVVRALNLESAEYDASFGDVKSEDWFAGYIATAYKKGLVNGADGNFRPNDTITREEMCKIIASAVETQTELDEISFSDNEQISSWAVDGVRKAYSLGIIKGMDDGSFAPKNNALREQAFVMLARLIEKIK